MLIASWVVCLGFIVGCGDDDKKPTDSDSFGSIAGTVAFRGTWPAEGDVQVSLYSTLSPPWVPMGPPDAATDPIASGSTSYSFTFDGLDPATYAAVYVSWRDPANPTNARLLGMYWAFADSVGIDSGSGLPRTQPSAVTIEGSSLDAQGIDIAADLDLAP
jgi:hypothetical protein